MGCVSVCWGWAGEGWVARLPWPWGCCPNPAVSPRLFSRTAWERPGSGEHSAGRGCLRSWRPCWCCRQPWSWSTGGNPRGRVRATGLELLPVSLALLTLRGAELPVSGSSHCPDPGKASGSCASGSIPRATAGRGAQQEDAVVS